MAVCPSLFGYAAWILLHTKFTASMDASERSQSIIGQQAHVSKSSVTHKSNCKKLVAIKGRSTATMLDLLAEWVLKGPAMDKATHHMRGKHAPN